MDQPTVPAPRRAVTLEELRTHRNQIQQCATRYGIDNVRVFGSVAHGSATAESDLDLLVDLRPGHGYLDLTQFALDVEDLLHVFTQVATPGGLKPRLRDRVLDEAVPL
jgi:hypothetical protein